MNAPRVPGDSRAALVTGTSAEFLGKRPLPRVLRRPLVWVLGPAGVGKSAVATRLAGPERVRLDAGGLRRVLAECAATGHWPEDVATALHLVLDGPSWLRARPGVATFLGQLLVDRVSAGRRTWVVQCDDDPSMEVVLDALPPEAVAVVGLRFPAGVRGRRRAVRRMCEELGVPRERGHGLASLEPWSYAAVRAVLLETR